MKKTKFDIFLDDLTAITQILGGMFLVWFIVHVIKIILSHV